MLGKSMIQSAQFLLAGVAACAIGANASAQDSQPAQANGGGAPDIVVTAQKRSENIRNVPIAIQALSGDSLQNSGFTDLRDMTAIVPSFRADNPGNPASTSFAIRGVGQRDVNPIGENNVAVFIDGAYVSFIGAVGQPLFDLERVEVLKGPQGTLFGRNATGGLVNIITKKPTDYLDGYLTTEVSSFSGLKVEGAVGGPLSDIVKARLSLSYDKADGYLKNTSGPDLLAKKNYSGRLQVEVTPTERLTLNLSGRYWHAAKVPGVGLSATPYMVDANGNTVSPPSEAAYIAYCQSLPPYFSTPPSGAWQGGSCLAAQSDPLKGSYGTSTNFEEKYYDLSSTIQWEMSDAVSLTSITDYQHATMDSAANVTSGPSGALYQIYTRPQKQFSEELRLSGEAGALKWQTGLYYLYISHNVETVPIRLRHTPTRYGMVGPLA